MKAVQKLILGEVEKCYTSLGLRIAGRPVLVYAGEGDGCICAYAGEGFHTRTDISRGGGGTMSLVEVRGKEGWMFASRGFYSMVDCGSSTIEIIRYEDGAFHMEKVAEVPYLHRFGVVYGLDGTGYMVAATLHGGKKDKADWSTPGHVLWTELPENLGAPFTLAFRQFDGDFYINHGFCTARDETGELALTSSREGVFRFAPPAKKGEAWQRAQLLSGPVSDVALLDIDGDGNMELATISPFHGDTFRVYRVNGGAYEAFYEYPVANDFYHTVISGTMDGTPVVVGGARMETADLFVLRWNGEDNRIQAQQLDVGAGPSNADILNDATCDYVISANRQIGQAAVYLLQH